MKIIRSTDANFAPRPLTPRHLWKILVVDDEPDVRTVTRLTLRDFTFSGRSLEILEASSVDTAQAVLQQHPDIAVALLDVVMETDDAGLKLVEYIRKTLNNQMIRLVIRTGQPGVAPERFVIDHYDIDDYKDKTELTATRLYTTLRSAIKAYRDLSAIEINRNGLESILQATPALYRIGASSLGQFFSGVLSQIIGLCQLSHATHIGNLNGMITTFNHGEMTIQAYTNHFTDSPRLQEIHDECVLSVTNSTPAIRLRENAEVLPLYSKEQAVGYIYIEPIEPLNDDDRNLIHIMAQQCSQALENLRLHGNIVTAFDNAIDMLAEIAEFKDKATGDHINRLDHYTRKTALALGINDEEATRFGKASRLHDVGKIGIPDHILGKPGKLTAEEFDIIKTHTVLGATILGHDTSFEIARDIALHHHERWDGKGYPDGSPAGELPLVTRIVSVVDVFDALISQRPYKDAWDIRRARETIANGAGTQFDPQVVHAFLELLDHGEFDPLIQRASPRASAS